MCSSKIALKTSALLTHLFIFLPIFIKQFNQYASLFGVEWRNF